MSEINSDINVIGSIPDFGLLEVALGKSAQAQGRLDLKEMLVTHNAFDFRTESARGRFLRAINRSILVFSNDRHKALVQNLFCMPGLESLKRKAIFWQLLSGNELFRLVSKEVYAKAYFSGRATLTGAEIFAYLKDLQAAFPQSMTFSDSTLDKIASKYLTILKKLEMVQGITKKRLLNIRLSEQEMVFFVYFCLCVDHAGNDILKSRFREFFFLDKAELIQTLKNIKFIPFLDVTSTGDTMHVDLKMPPQELLDVLCHRK